MNPAADYVLTQMSSGRFVPMPTSSRLVPLVGALLILLAATACTRSPVYRLHSTVPDETADWLQGRKYVTRSTDSVTATLAYVRTNRHGHMFDLHLENRSRDTVIANPARLFADTYQLVPTPDTSRDVSPYLLTERTFAVDPEKKLIAIDIGRERAEAREQTSSALYLLSTAAAAGSDIADGADTPEENAQDAAERADREASRANDRIRYEQKTEQLRSGRIHWSEDTFRKTTLPPRTGVRGYVYLPVIDDARYLLVHIGLFEDNIVFPYRQTKH